MLDVIFVSLGRESWGGGVLDVICVSLERVLLAVRCDLCFIGKGVTGCQM